MDLEHAALVADASLPNPQNLIGLDIMTRARYSTKSDAHRRETRKMIRNAVGDAVLQLLHRLGSDTSAVEQAVLVGNTVMHHLFFDHAVDSLLDPPYESQVHEPEIGEISDLNIWEGASGVYYAPAPFRSFVGSDALCMLLGFKALEHSKADLFIDVGTNTEVSVFKDGEGWIGSAASGPAFEGMSLECGVEAVPGSIVGTSIDPRTLRPQNERLAGERPIGICGTGAVSVLAELKRKGLMNRAGSLDRSTDSLWLTEFGSSRSYVLSQAVDSGTGRPIYISQRDIRMLQESKAAIAASIVSLLTHSGLDADEVRRVHISGAFGMNLTIDDSVEIGLFPRLQNAVIERAESAAIRGAGRLLLSPDSLHDLEKIRRQLQYVDFESDASFQNAYTAARFFEPL